MSNSRETEKSLHAQLTDDSSSALKRYQLLVLGSESLFYLVKFELIMLFVSALPGALGLLLRKKLYPTVLGSVGKSVVFGRNVSIRHGNKINLADGVVVDDNVTLDAKGESNKGISVGEGCIVSKNAVLSCKNGNISIGSGCTIGINTIVHATQDSDVVLGDNVLLAAQAYLIGGGSYGIDDLDRPFKEQGQVSLGGIHIESNVWIGSSAQILDGVKVGTGAIVGSGAVVNRHVERYHIVAGVPIKTIRSRKPDDLVAGQAS